MNLRRLAPPALFWLTACNSPLIGSGEEDDLRDQRRKWVQLAISDYTYEFQRSCFCGGPVRPLQIRVHDDSVVSVIAIETGRPPEFLPANWAGTIDDVFTEIQRLFDQGADEVELDFDSSFHFPSRARVDRIRNAIDDELMLQLSNLQPLR
jgi:uncharacterized protein DUF6174